MTTTRQIRAGVVVKQQRVMYHIAGGVWISLAGGQWRSRNRAIRSPKAEGDRPPGSDERLFRHDLPRVRDEPEQDDGVWIGILSVQGGRGEQPGRPGNSTGEPGNTPEDVGNDRVPPPTAPLDLGNIGAAISHSSGA